MRILRQPLVAGLHEAEDTLDDEGKGCSTLARLSRFEGYEDTKYLILLIATSVGLHYTVAGGVTPAVVILGGGWAGSSSASFCKSSFSSGLGWV